MQSFNTRQTFVVDENLVQLETNLISFFAGKKKKKLETIEKVCSYQDTDEVTFHTTVPNFILVAER